MTPKNLMQFGWSSCAHSRTSFCSSGRSFAPSLAFPICLATASRPSSLQLKTVPKPPSPSLGGRGGAEYAAAAVGCMETLTLRLAEAALVVAATH